MKTSKTKKGCGLLNKAINNLPFEVHIPGYQYCGPGTKLKKRLARGDQGINPLDKACKQHDISYSQNRDSLEARHAADQVLAEESSKRVLAKNSSLGEKAAALAVTSIMKAKTRLGMGLKKKRGKKIASARKLKEKLKEILHRKKSPVTTALRQIVSAARKVVKKQADPIPKALQAARQAVQLAGGSRCIRKPRVLPIPKTGGALPALLIPLFAALGAAGSVAGKQLLSVKDFTSSGIGKDWVFI